MVCILLFVIVYVLESLCRLFFLDDIDKVSIFFYVNRWYMEI